jgi:hypothetical protein
MLIITIYGAPPPDLAGSRHYIFLNFLIQVVIE